jgi:hypothetical protein
MVVTFLLGFVAAWRGDAAEAEAASAVFLSVIGSVITMAAFIALTS